MNTLIRWLALAINIIIWTVLGLICWIPLLARTTASLSAAILVSTISDSDPTHLRESFENAVSFYARGYEAIYRVLGPERRIAHGRRGILISDSDDVKSVGPSEKTRTEIRWDRVVLELFWTVIFWGSLGFAIFRLFIASEPIHLPKMPWD